MRLRELRDESAEDAYCRHAPQKKKKRFMFSLVESGGFLRLK